MAIKLNVFVLHGTGNKQVWGKYIINIENGPQKTRWLDGGEDLGSNCPFCSFPAYLCPSLNFTETDYLSSKKGKESRRDSMISDLFLARPSYCIIGQHGTTRAEPSSR